MNKTEPAVIANFLLSLPTPLNENEERALIYEGVDDDGGDCTLFFSKTDDGHSFVVIRYDFGAIMFLFEVEQ